MLEEIARALVGIVVLAWLPGHAWRRVLLPLARGLAGFVADVILSVSLVTVAVYASSAFLGVPISAPTALWWALGIAAAALAPSIASFVERRVLTARA